MKRGRKKALTYDELKVEFDRANAERNQYRSQLLRRECDFEQARI